MTNRVVWLSLLLVSGGCAISVKSQPQPIVWHHYRLLEVPEPTYDTLMAHAVGEVVASTMRRHQLVYHDDCVQRHEQIDVTVLICPHPIPITDGILLMTTTVPPPELDP